METLDDSLKCPNCPFETLNVQSMKSHLKGLENLKKCYFTPKNDQILGKAEVKESNQSRIGKKKPSNISTGNPTKKAKLELLEKPAESPLVTLQPQYVKSAHAFIRKFVYYQLFVQ